MEEEEEQSKAYATKAGGQLSFNTLMWKARFLEKQLLPTYFAIIKIVVFGNLLIFKAAADCCRHALPLPDSSLVASSRTRSRCGERMKVEDLILISRGDLSELP
jgi:hypothetical protein